MLQRLCVVKTESKTDMAACRSRYVGEWRLWQAQLRVYGVGGDRTCEALSAQKLEVEGTTRTLDAVMRPQTPSGQFISHIAAK
jgi:hypothetical protein